MNKTSVLALVAFCFANGFCEDFIWIASQGGETPIESFAFGDSANWLDGRVPSTYGDAAYITNIHVAADTFIKVPHGQILGSVYGDGRYPLSLLGTELTLQGSGGNGGSISYKNYGGKNTRLFFDKVNSDGTINLILGDLCSPVKCAKLVFAGGNNCCRFNEYAPSGNPERGDGEWDIPTITQGDGSFILKAPHGGPATTRAFNLTAGSAYAQCSNARALVVGASVSGDGIPEGTYLKRIVGSEWVELSSPASKDALEETLTIGEFHPKFKLVLPDYRIQGNSPIEMTIAADSAESDAVLEIQKLSGVKNASGCLRMGAGGYAYTGKIILHDTSAYKALTLLSQCHIQFEEGSGLTNCVTTFQSASYKSRITVTNNITAEISTITNFIGKLIKDGDGVLRLGIKGIPETHTGSITIEGGTIEILENEDGTMPTIGKIEIAGGGTLVVPEQGLATGTLIAEDGATIRGTGKITVSKEGDISKAQFGAGVSVEMPSMNPAVHEIPSAAVIGEPAFWVASDATDSLVLSEDGERCTKWIDVRGSGYGFATNVVESPSLTTNLFKKKILSFAYKGKDAIGESLVWNKPLTNIKAVFTVFQTSGGPMLASSGQVPYDFNRNCASTGQPLASQTAHEDVRNGVWYVDGEHCDCATGYPYTSKVLCRLAEVHIPGEGVSADAFGFGLGITANNNTIMQIGEVIVYTNELSYAQRLQVGQYLMKKWRNADISYSATGSETEKTVKFESNGNLAFDVKAGDFLNIDTIKSSNLSKTGEGTLAVRDFNNPDFSISVTGGTLELQSTEDGATSDTVFPYPPAIHFDAVSIEEDDLSAYEDGTKRLTVWKGMVEGVDATAMNTNAPVYKKVSGSTLKDNMPVVDFGKMTTTNEGYGLLAKTGCYMSYKKTPSIHSVFAVIGSAQGGGAILGTSGRYEGYNDGGVMRDFENSNLDSDWTKPIISDKINYATSVRMKRSSRFRINGEEAFAVETGFSGAYDLVSLTTHENLTGSGLGCIHYGRNAGGQEIGEFIAFTNELNNVQQARIDAYLMKKWFGADTPGFRPAVASKVTVGEGATLKLFGGAIETGVIGGAGTIDGSVTASGTPEVEISVKDDGTLRTLLVTGSVDFEKAGIIRFTGNAENLKPGLYDVIVADSISNQGKWICETDTGKSVTVRISGGTMQVSVNNPETIIIIR